jgi:hypothetical protein
VFYVEHFLKVDAEISGSGVSQNGKSLSAAGFAGVGGGILSWTVSVYES